MKPQHCLDGCGPDLQNLMRTKFEKKIQEIQFFSWSMLHQIFHQVDDGDGTSVDLKKKVFYGQDSGDLNNELVRYSNGPK